MYKEIEKNPIRLAIKKDDALTFQSLLSKSNLSVNATVTESIVEHFLRVPIEMHYIEYAAQYNAINVNDNYVPTNVVLYEDKNNFFFFFFFFSKDQPDNWICFEFKNHSIIPTDYTIISWKNSNDNPSKNWVIEGSKDKNEWEILDMVQNSNYLNGASLIHTSGLYLKF